MNTEAQYDAKGMVRKQPYAKANPAVFYPIFTLVLTGLGLLAAWGIHSIDSETSDKQIADLKAKNLGYLYIAIFIFGLTLQVQQVFVAAGRKAAYCDNPDQYVYEVVGKADLPYVRLVEEGPIGEFNRSQRGIDNSREAFPMVVAHALLAGYVYPQAVLTISVVYFLARTWFSHGYVQKSTGRMPGQLFTMLAIGVALNGLSLFAGIKALV